MFSIADAIARLAGRRKEIAAARALRKSEERPSIEGLSEAIARLEAAEREAIAEIERLEKEEPQLLVEGEDADLKALRAAIADAAIQRDQSRAIAGSLKGPLAQAIAEADAEEKRRQALFEKVGPAIAPYEKKFAAEYSKAYAGLKAVVAAAPLDELREVYNASFTALPAEKMYHDLPGRGFLEAMGELASIFRQMRSPKELETDFLYGAWETRWRKEEEAKRAAVEAQRAERLLETQKPHESEMEAYNRRKREEMAIWIAAGNSAADFEQPHVRQVDAGPQPDAYLFQSESQAADSRI
jgi:hypothetical protein